MQEIVFSANNVFSNCIDSVTHIVSNVSVFLLVEYCNLTCSK